MDSYRMTVAASLIVAATFMLGVACGSEEDGGDTDAVGTIPSGGGAASAPSGGATSNPTTAPTLTVPPANGEANDSEEFIDTVQAQLEQIQARLDEVEAEAANVDGEQQLDAQARLDDLNARIAEIETQLTELESASGEEYETAKTNIEENVERAMTETQQLADELGI